MCALNAHTPLQEAASKPSPRTRHTELLRLCARIGYSPPCRL